MPARPAGVAERSDTATDREIRQDTVRPTLILTIEMRLSPRAKAAAYEKFLCAPGNLPTASISTTNSFRQISPRRYNR